jgi:methylmalonyl-CoA mutase N-terminal domain/subunit
LEQREVERLRAMRAKRSQSRWQQGIDAVKERARNGGNLMPAILEAVESNCTVGEIAGTLRTVFGEYRETVVI